MISVFSYTDYRKFISDYFAERKRCDKGFSHAVFAKKAGYKSRSFIIKVINGEKALSAQSVGRVAKAMDLQKKERDYFKALVYFNNEKSLNKKSRFFEILQSTHQSNKSVLLRNDQFEYFKHWYSAVLREVAVFSDFNDDFRKLGSMLDPPISAIEAKRGIELLVRLGLIKKQNGSYVQTDTVITTGDEVQNIAVANFQRETSDLSRRAISRLGNKQEISTLTFGTNKMGFKEIQSEIRAFRKKLITIIASQNPLDRVYQLNLQLFPMTKLPKKEDGDL
ncbi:MAG: TIGR02147 family protein [Chitinivibrionales bacterium]